LAEVALATFCGGAPRLVVVSLADQANAASAGYRGAQYVAFVSETVT
jgi:hypothetical protein